MRNLYTHISICFSYFLGIPEGKPGQQHLYRVTSVPPRVGAVLQPPHCITCVKGPVPTPSPYYGMVSLHKSKNWDDEWTEEDIPPPPTAAPKAKKKVKKGNFTYTSFMVIIIYNS